jgi:hypothetical protein
MIRLMTPSPLAADIACYSRTNRESLAFLMESKLVGGNKKCAEGRIFTL